MVSPEASVNQWKFRIPDSKCAKKMGEMKASDKPKQGSAPARHHKAALPNGNGYGNGYGAAAFMVYGYYYYRI